MREGFTLVELLVVAAVIAVAAVVGFGTRPTGACGSMEVAAIGALRTLSSAQNLFWQRDPDRDGVSDYGSLAELGAAGLIDPVLATGTKLGYAFSVSVTARGWSAWADPLEPGMSSRRHFFADQSGVVRASPERAGPTSPALRSASPTRSSLARRGVRR